MTAFPALKTGITEMRGNTESMSNAASKQVLSFIPAGRNKGKATLYRDQISLLQCWHLIMNNHNHSLGVILTTYTGLYTEISWPRISAREGRLFLHSADL